MPTTINIMVNTNGGGDYSTLAAAWAAEGAGYDFVGNDVIKKFICSGTTADPSYNLLIDATTDTTRYPWFYCDPTDNVGRHPGHYSTGYYRIESNSYSGLMRIRCNAIVDGLQGKNTYTSGSADGPGHGFCADETKQLVIVRNCILWKSGAATNPQECIGVGAKNMYYGNYRFVAYNNIIFGDWDDGLFMWSEPGQNDTGFFYNNTVIDPIVYGFYWDRDNGGTGSICYLKNNLFQNAGTADYFDDSGTAGTLTSATNITEDATSPDGASFQSIALTFADAVSDDYRLAAGDTDAIDTGTDLSAVGAAQFEFSDDNQGRPIVAAAWDIGGDQYQTPGTEVPFEVATIITSTETVAGSLS